MTICGRTCFPLSNQTHFKISGIVKFPEGLSSLKYSYFHFTDAHDNVFMQVDNSACTAAGGPDTNAFCACGTVSGVYQPVCNKGFYGAGTQGNCHGKF